MNYIGANIKKFREFKNLSQQQTSDHIGVNRTELSYFETGERIPNLDVLNRLSTLFGIDLDILLEEDSSIVKAETAFAYRTDNLTNSDINAISDFHKIVKNYIKIQSL